MFFFSPLFFVSFGRKVFFTWTVELFGCAFASYSWFVVLGSSKWAPQNAEVGFLIDFSKHTQTHTLTHEPNEDDEEGKNYSSSNNQQGKTTRTKALTWVNAFLNH